MIKSKGHLILALTYCVILAACTHSKSAVGQSDVSNKSRALFNKALTKQGYGEYDEAIVLFKQAIKKSPKFEDAYDALAHTYQKKNNLSSAKNVYLKLLTINTEHYYALFELGKIYFENRSLDSSEMYFKKFLTVNKTNDKNSSKAIRSLQNISFTREAIANPVDITPRNLGTNINTREQEYSPAFAIDEKKMYITRRTGNLRDNRPNEDIYFSDQNPSGDWQKIRNMGPPINTVENEGAFSVSSDGHYIFFTSCSRSGGKGQCDIWLTMDQNGKWSDPMNLQEPINTKYWESQPSIASNGKVLYFTSDRPGGYGGTDIWKSNFGEDGWEEPINLGPEINTSLDEQFPFIHSDNVTLYFSSEGHPGMGKSDLFISRLRPDSKWETPKNLGYPINTAGYDWNMVVSRDGKTAYYSSDNFKDGEGGLDIYSFELPEHLKAKKVSYVRGIVRDAETKKLLSASVLLSPQDGSEATSTYADSKKGEFVVPLVSNKKYNLTIDKKGYLFHSEYFDMPNVPSDQPYELYIDLKRLSVGKTVVLNNIFFDTDKFSLKTASNKELEKLKDFLLANSTISIEISGHTDNQGSSQHNLTLSENRAKAVYDYLLDNGIDSSRLSYKGYGDTSPIASNDTKEGRSKNRRTEFKVIK